MLPPDAIAQMNNKAKSDAHIKAKYTSILAQIECILIDSWIDPLPLRVWLRDLHRTVHFPSIKVEVVRRLREAGWEVNECTDPRVKEEYFLINRKGAVYPYTVFPDSTPEPPEAA